MKIQASHSAALSRLFSAGVFHELARKGRSPLFSRLVNECGLDSDHSDDATVGDVFEKAFAQLRKAGLRNEYVYRAALVKNILLGTHSLATASMLTEFRAGQSKADLVILNGTATVYEIKSDRDTLSRLEKQVADYQRVFAKVFVIASADHVEDVIGLMPGCVGVMCLKRWNRITTLREAVEHTSSIDPATVLDSLRSSEAVSILEKLGREVPNVPNTRLRTELLRKFQSLPPDLIHSTMVSVLKDTRDLSTLSSFVKVLPQSLQAAALTFKIRSDQQSNLVNAISTPIVIARSWD